MHRICPVVEIHELKYSKDKMWQNMTKTKYVVVITPNSEQLMVNRKINNFNFKLVFLYEVSHISIFLTLSVTWALRSLPTHPPISASSSSIFQRKSIKYRFPLIIACVQLNYFSSIPSIILFIPNASFLYSLKISENRKTFYVFRG